MSKKKYDNGALQLQLQITSEISELLKNRGVNISAMKVDLKAVKKKKKIIGKEDKDIVTIEGTINLEINSRLNDRNNTYSFRSEDEDDEEEILDEDFITR